MKGFIFGQQNDKIWFQQIFKSKFKFQNPLFQNYKHTKTISENFHISHDNIESIVIFIGSSIFKNEMPKNVFNNVFKMVNYIKSFKNLKYTSIEAYTIYQNIKNERLPDNLITQYKHVKDLKNKRNINNEI